NAGLSVVDVRALLARLAAIATAPAAGVRRRAPRFVSVGDRGDLPRRRFAARRFRRSVVDGAYGSAPAVADGRAAFAFVRRPLLAAAARAAGACVETRSGTVSRIYRITAARAQADPPAVLLARVHDHESDVAHAGAL